MNRFYQKAVDPSSVLFMARKALSLWILLFALGFERAQAVLIFRDNFEYAVDRSGTGPCPNFVNNGWQWVKSNNCGQSGARGYIYTATSISGYVGTFPGASSSRVLALESRAYTLAGQTDFYLQYGLESGAMEQIPGNVWFQFWIYPNHYGSELTEFHSREKFLYPCASYYPCSDNRWLWMLAQTSYPPFYDGPLYDGNAYIVERDNSVGYVNNANAAPENADKLGQTNISEHIAANRWTLVKVHFDTSGPNGLYEAWLRPLGGNWTKVAEWIGGVTPNFLWTLNESERGGHKMLRMPTTFPAANTTPLYDAWIYMDDFAIATDEGDLPTYEGTPADPPSPPRGLRVR